MATTSSIRSPLAGSINSPNEARPGASSCPPALGASRSMDSAMARASGPASRTTPMPPRPGGVATATMVSSRFTALIVKGAAEVRGTTQTKGVSSSRESVAQATSSSSRQYLQLFRRLIIASTLPSLLRLLREMLHPSSLRYGGPQSEIEESREQLSAGNRVRSRERSAHRLTPAHRGDLHLAPWRRE